VTVVLLLVKQVQHILSTQITNAAEVVAVVLLMPVQVIEHSTSITSAAEVDVLRVLWSTSNLRRVVCIDAFQGWQVDVAYLAV
jgi:hypothetical protein